MLGLPGIEEGDHIEFDRAVRDTERPAADSGRWGSTSRRWRRVWTGLWRTRTVARNLEADLEAGWAKAH